MKTLLTWIVMVPFAIVVIVFSAVNLDMVMLDLWPFAAEVTVPLYALVLVVFIVGFVFGGLVAWLSGSEQRRRARNSSWRAATAERELRSVSNKLHERERDLAHVRDEETARRDGDKTLPTTTSGA